ncbi:MAG: hypothetical protein RLZ84_1058 [Actinomycetota bacterium]
MSSLVLASVSPIVQAQNTVVSAASPRLSVPALTGPKRLLIDWMSVSTGKGFSTAQVRGIQQIAKRTGFIGFGVRFPTLQMREHRRTDGVRVSKGAGATVSGGWVVPLATMALDVKLVSAISGVAVADVLSDGRAVIGVTSARLRDAKVGDVLVVNDKWGKPFEIEIGAIVDDDHVDNGDLLVSTDFANRLMATQVHKVLVIGEGQPTDFQRELRSGTFRNGAVYRLRRSWDAPDPDSTLGTAKFKELLGEFRVKDAGNGRLHISNDWRGVSIKWLHTFKDIPIRANCHKEIVGPLQGALTEVFKSGLAKAIDVRNTNRYGGCFQGRISRLADDFGNVSRHSWGGALDINTTTNGQGMRPTLSCQVVRIFRKWGFAWGGNFAVADGMHFEYVGEPRHEWGFNSQFCPNEAPVPTTSIPRMRLTPRTTLESTTTTTTTSTTTTTTPGAPDAASTTTSSTTTTETTMATTVTTSP